MRGDDLLKLLEVAGRSLAERAESDAELRSALARIGRWLVEVAERLPERSEVESEIAAGDSSPSAATGVDGPTTTSYTSGELASPVGGESEAAGDRGTLQAGSRLIAPAQPSITGPRVVAMPPPAPSHRTLDLALIQKRCRLKAEGCRWAITRCRRLAERADFKTAIAPHDNELVERARSTSQCYLWMLDPYGIMPPDDPVLSVIDACYTNLADAAALVREVQRRQQASNDGSAVPGLEEPVRLLAEAQSALRVILTEAGLRLDQDQIDAFAWLKEFTYVERIYLDRFMRLDNAADPYNWSDLHDRIERLRDEMEETNARATRRTKLLNRARYHTRKLDDGDLDDWRKIMDSIDELVEDGVPPSDLEIRELLLPLVDEIPDDVETGPGATQAVREVDRYMASREAARETVPPPVREPTGDVRRVAALLGGKTIVLIGGDERLAAARAIERGFELERLRWIATKPHQSIAFFESEVARDETALVMLAIRFSSHSFEGVKAMCDRYGKPFVRLPGGYGVNQVARQILAQVANRLAGRE